MTGPTVRGLLLDFAWAGEVPEAPNGPRCPIGIGSLPPVGALDRLRGANGDGMIERARSNPWLMVAIAAGVDVVYVPQAPSLVPELTAMENVVLFPHLGSASVWTRQKMGQLVVDNLAAWFARKPLLTQI